MRNSYESGNAVLQTIHSSEGSRALKLLEQRKRSQNETEAAKKEIEEKSRKRLHRIGDKYRNSSTEALEEEFKQDTVGLVSAEEFKERRRLLEQKRQQQQQSKDSIATPAQSKRIARTVRSKLSFGDEECDEGEESEFSVKEEAAAVSASAAAEIQIKKKNFGKDPGVDTSFLTDAERELRLLEERERIIREYREEQQRILEGVLSLKYSYWEGIDHERVIKLKTGGSVGHFLGLCRKELEKEFPELRNLSIDNLLFVKEDTIFPNSITFYDLIKCNARGKTGPLFDYEMLDSTDTANLRIEKEESPPGKIVDKRWYDKNRHIFPASRWEPCRADRKKVLANS